MFPAPGGGARGFSAAPSTGKIRYCSVFAYVSSRLFLFPAFLGSVRRTNCFICSVVNWKRRFFRGVASGYRLLFFKRNVPFLGRKRQIRKYWFVFRRRSLRCISLWLRRNDMLSEIAIIEKFYHCSSFISISPINRLAYITFSAVVVFIYLLFDWSSWCFLLLVFIQICHCIAILTEALVSFTVKFRIKNVGFVTSFYKIFLSW